MPEENLYKELSLLLCKIREERVWVGQLLRDIRDGELWKEEIGAGVETWADFLKQPEIGLTVNEANFLIRAYEYAVENQIDPQDLAKVPERSLRLLVKHGGDIEEAKTLTTQDFRERYYDVTHDKDERTYTYLVMRRCNETGSLQKVHGIESEEVLEKFNGELEHG